MQRDINLTIKLEGIDSFPIRISMEEETVTREAQKTVNLLYNSWQEKMPNLTPLELMGRIAFYMARRYEETTARMNEINETAELTEKEFDSILLSLE